jgi:hypothetical protein
MLHWFWQRFPGLMAGLSLLYGRVRYEPDRSGDQVQAVEPHEEQAP